MLQNSRTYLSFFGLEGQYPLGWYCELPDGMVAYPKDRNANPSSVIVLCRLFVLALWAAKLRFVPAPGAFRGQLRLPHVLVVIGCLGLVGCSEKQPMAQVAGRVVYSEDATAATDLAGHRVSFLCNHGEIDGKRKMRISATGLIAEDGTFAMSTYEMGDGVLLGSHQIAVAPPLALVEVKPIIHPRFCQPSTSGLTADIDGDTEVVLEVQRAQ